MSASSVVRLSSRILAITAIHFAVFAAASAALLPPAPAAGADTQAAARSAMLLLVVCALNAAVLSLLILRSRWTGARLALTIFVVFYGVMTVMNQIESLVFLTELPPGMVPGLFLMGAVVAAIVAPAAVLILGRWRGDARAHRPRRAGQQPASEWAWKLALIAVAYVVLYFTFGYFVAWRSPAVRAYYGGVDPGSVVAQLRSVFAETPWLPALQLLRGLLWAALAIPVIRMMTGAWWEAGLGTALLFSVVACGQLLLPNPYMPDPVRIAHLAETASSNFIFAWLVVWLLGRGHVSSRAPQPEKAGTAAI